MQKFKNLKKNWGWNKYKNIVKYIKNKSKII